MIVLKTLLCILLLINFSLKGSVHASPCTRSPPPTSMGLLFCIWIVSTWRAFAWKWRFYANYCSNKSKDRSLKTSVIMQINHTNIHGTYNTEHLTYYWFPVIWMVSCSIENCIHLNQLVVTIAIDGTFCITSAPIIVHTYQYSNDIKYCMDEIFHGIKFSPSPAIYFWGIKFSPMQ